MRLRRMTVWGFAAALATLGGGCSVHYSQGGAADLGALGVRVAGVPAVDGETGDAPVPEAGFPATIAVVRVQAGSGRRGSSGGFTVIGVREAETGLARARLASLPLVRSLAPLNRLVIEPNARGEADLREAAARLGADMLLMYTCDTRSDVETTVPLLGFVTLGLFPAEEVRTVTTVSAALLDVRSGFVYAVAEATDETSQPANAWTSGDAVSQTRRRAERRSFERLVDELERAWEGVLEAHGPRL